MTKLTPVQADLLQAATAPDGAEGNPENSKTARALIKRGLLISLPREKDVSRLIVTQAGRVIVGVSTEPAAPSPSPKQKRSQRTSVAPSVPAANPSEPGQPKGKLGILVAQLRQPEGAKIEELMAATGWQAHSVRGAISGALKKQLKLAVLSEKTATGRVYRIVDAAAEARP